MSIQSKKLRVFLVSTLVLLVNNYLPDGAKVDVEIVQYLVYLVMTYLVGQGIADIGKNVDIEKVVNVLLELVERLAKDGR